MREVGAGIVTLLAASWLSVIYLAVVGSVHLHGAYLLCIVIRVLGLGMLILATKVIMRILVEVFF